MAIPEDYIAALEHLALVFSDYKKKTNTDAVLVGGAATAILTAGEFMSGDFDVVAPSDDDFNRSMLDYGFVEEDRVGKLRIGFYHRDHPKYGFQQVSGPLFDGRSERGRLIHISVTATGQIALPCVEDLIADRLAQHAIASPSDDSRLRQARTLFRLAEAIDRAYLLQRISEEGGDPALLSFP